MELCRQALFRKPVRKGVIIMVTNRQKKWLNNQEYQILRQKRQLTENLYAILEELEGRPIRHPHRSFPFNFLVGGISKILDSIESMVDKAVLKALTKIKDHSKSKKR